MKPGRGKAKGNSFENVVAKKLSEALDPLKFIRTQGSGARVGGKNFDTLGQMFGEDALKLFVGDVVPVNERDVNLNFKFSVECKFYKTPDSFGQLVAGTANIFKWMQESMDDAKKIDRCPLLIFKWNNTPIYIAGLEKDLHGRGAQITLSQPGKMTMNIMTLDSVLEYKNFWVYGTDFKGTF